MAVPVSGAFHTPFMAAAQARLDAALSAATMSPGRVPVGANVDGLLHGPNTNWSGLLARQLCSPVRWSQLLGSLCEAGVTTLIELGPGTVLSGLAKRGAPGARAEAASTPAELNAIADLKQAELERTSARDAAGEQLDAPQRLVISHVAGVFCPADGLSDGDAVTAGDVIGRVGNEIVRSRFTGRLMGLLAWRGERVAIWQPLLWLRVF